MKKIDCPDCDERMELETHILYTEDQDRIELDFPTCNSCGHVMYNTNYE